MSRWPTEPLPIRFCEAVVERGTTLEIRGWISAVRLLRRRAEFGLLGARRAELEFGNLAERIERGVGQQARRGLRITEWHEHHVLRHVAVGTHLDLDRAAARLQPDEITGPHLQPPHVL